MKASSIYLSIIAFAISISAQEVRSYNCGNGVPTVSIIIQGVTSAKSELFFPFLRACRGDKQESIAAGKQTLPPNSAVVPGILRSMQLVGIADAQGFTGSERAALAQSVFELRKIRCEVETLDRGIVGVTASDGLKTFQSGQSILAPVKSLNCYIDEFAK